MMKIFKKILLVLAFVIGGVIIGVCSALIAISLEEAKLRSADSTETTASDDGALISPAADGGEETPGVGATPAAAAIGDPVIGVASSNRESLILGTWELAAPASQSVDITAQTLQFFSDGGGTMETDDIETGGDGFVDIVWRMENNNLIITPMPGLTMTYPIVELSASSLVYEEDAAGAENARTAYTKRS